MSLRILSDYVIYKVIKKIYLYNIIVGINNIIVLETKKSKK